jgi:FdhE protein
MLRMTQRILERGQIETLASRSIPRVRLPARADVFARRATRLRALAQNSALEGYLHFLAAIADAQQVALGDFHPQLPTAEQIDRATEFRMPPMPATSWPRDENWIGMLHAIANAIAANPTMPEGVVSACKTIAATARDQLEEQADALLAATLESADLAMAPLVMAALQVHWVALTAVFADADEVHSLDVPGVCPLCGTLPVASIVRAQNPYQGYRYLHCALCASEWHMVRVQCTHCGADSKRVAYHTLQAVDAGDDVVKGAAVRAEGCDECHCYRKILYQEKDMAVDPVADDVATLALDVLLTEKGFHRASGNPMLWQAAQD